MYESAAVKILRRRWSPRQLRIRHAAGILPCHHLLRRVGHPVCRAAIYCHGNAVHFARGRIETAPLVKAARARHQTSHVRQIAAAHSTRRPAAVKPLFIERSPAWIRAQRPILVNAGEQVLVVEGSLGREPASSL